MRTLLQRRSTAAVLFSLALLFFLDRGAYRAIRDSRTGDFATIYAAARCWLHHENPYDRAALRNELVSSGAGAALIREQDQHASLYLLPAMPFVALLAWLPWTAATVTWCLLSLGCFFASLAALLQDLRLSNTSKWIAASACLLFSPTYVGVLNGNPSVLSISLTILSLHYAMRGRVRICWLLFATTLCIKPQIALCSLLAFLLWKCWTPLLLGSATAAMLSALAIWQASLGQNFAWWDSLRQNFVKEASPGGLVDPRTASPYASELLNSQTLTYFLSSNPHVAEGLVAVLMIGLAANYFRIRTRGQAPGWTDVAFCAAVTLAVTYHRYYDGQLLLVLVPAMVQLWQNGRVRSASVLLGCFVLLAFPLQSIFDRALGPAATERSLAQFILLRHEPLAILAVALALGFGGSVPRRTQALQNLV